jgi:hypothetical protein
MSSTFGINFLFVPGVVMPSDSEQEADIVKEFISYLDDSYKQNSSGETE